MARDDDYFNPFDYEFGEPDQESEVDDDSEADVTDLDQLWDFDEYYDYEDFVEYEFHGTGDTGAEAE
jgi:hypothetical protein